MNAHANPWDYRETIKWAMVKTVFLLAITALILDGGRIHRSTIAALFAYWAISVVIWVRHETAERQEIMFTRHGMWGILVVAVIAACLT